MSKNEDGTYDFNPNENYVAAVQAENAEAKGKDGDAGAAVGEAVLAQTMEAVAVSKTAGIPNDVEVAKIEAITESLQAGGDTKEADQAQKGSTSGAIGAAVVAGMAGAVAIDQAMEVLGDHEGIPPAAQEAMDYLKKSGLYRERFDALKPGEVPDEKFVANMISSLMTSSFNPSRQKGQELQMARTLTETLPYDRELLKKHVEKDVMAAHLVTEKEIAMMEIAGINPKDLHEKALEEMPAMLYDVAGERGEVREAKDVRAWRETFGIAEEEYVSALYQYWQQHTSKISDKHLRELGFVKQVGGSVKWAWESQ